MQEQRSKRSSRQIAAIVLLILMDMVLSFVEFPLIPGAPWLKYDASGMVAVFSGMLYGSGVGVLVAVVSWIPRFASDPFGALMNVLAALPLVAVMAAWYRPDRSFGGIALGCVVAVAAAVTVSVCMNFVITPLYLGVSYEEVASLVVPALLPFNVVKASANVVLAVVCATKLRGLLADER